MIARLMKTILAVLTAMLAASPVRAATDHADAVPMPMPQAIVGGAQADPGPPPAMLRMDHHTGEVTRADRPVLLPDQMPPSGPSGAARSPRGATDYGVVAADPRVVRILFTKPADGRSYLCSGSVISRYVVLTATHCIANGTTGHTNVQIVPAYDRLASPAEPYGRYAVRASGWYPQEFNGPMALALYNFDIGYYVTDQPIGDATGWFGWQSAQPATVFYTSTTFRTQGYPAEVVGDGTRQMARDLTYDYALSSLRQQYCYSRTGYGGSSGSAAFTGGVAYGVRSNGGSAGSCDVVIFPQFAADLAIAIARSEGTPIVPQTGWWWNAAQGGRGYAVEFNAATGNLFMGTFIYSTDAARTPIWYTSNCSYSTATGACSTTLQQFAGGQSLTGDYRPPTPLGSQGNIRLAFTSATGGTLTLPDGTNVPIVRFPFAGTAVPVAGDGGTPETGWWWNAQQSGRGWFMEVQKSAGGTPMLYLVGYMYDAEGPASWHVSTGPMTTATLYEGTLTRHQGGSPITTTTGTSPSTSSSLGAISIQFTSAGTARLILPGNAGSVDLTRFKP